MLSSKVKDKGSSPFPPVACILNLNYRMKLGLDFEYDKLNLKEITILVPKYHTNMVSFLTPILGLYGINVKEFINEFEIKTKFINFDVIIPVRVKISKIKTFKIYVKTPYITSILSNLSGFSLSKPNINVLTLYKISLIKSICYTNLLVFMQKKIYSSIRKYVSLIIKVNSTISVGKVKLNSLNLCMYDKVINIKKGLISFAFLNKVVSANFGVFTTFNNVNGVYINYLKTALGVYDLNIVKAKSKFLSSLIGKQYFSGSLFYISSNKFNNYLFFWKEIYGKNFGSNFFPIYYRFGLNLTCRSFFKSLITSFNIYNNFIYLVRVIHIIHLKLIKILHNLNILVVRLLNYKCQPTIKY
jgi:ribosomal protein L11